MSSIQSSIKAKRTFNPIRNIVDNLVPPQNHEKPMLNLSLGDPTVFGNLACPSVINNYLIEIINEQKSNGYLPSAGLTEARAAIAASLSTDDYPLTFDDVIIGSGCSGAIEIAITGLVNEGDNILVPKPAFPLYQVIANSVGANVKYYDLDPSKNWEIDIDSVISQADEKTKAIVITNPSNPCGSNFSREHLIEVANAISTHLPNIVVFADEIYGNCVFGFDEQTGKKAFFTPFHTVSGNIPVISFGGLAKEFVVPGWRVGWLVKFDRANRMTEYYNGLKALTQLILGGNSLIQKLIPKLLVKNNKELNDFHESYMAVLRENTLICEKELEGNPYLSVIKPQGAMYLMVKINVENLDDNIIDDKIFCEELLKEMNVFLLPGQCFNMKNFARLVISGPSHIILEALQRMKDFCEKHKKI